ncbi:hypothetical protein EV127DRAFT_422007 [Xylaria flabelliformis]|nr:hypothetical protein EV127DRAFT_422007 [Xylaria flabelliformis]
MIYVRDLSQFCPHKRQASRTRDSARSGGPRQRPSVRVLRICAFPRVRRGVYVCHVGVCFFRKLLQQVPTCRYSPYGEIPSSQYGAHDRRHLTASMQVYEVRIFMSNHSRKMEIFAAAAALESQVEQGDYLAPCPRNHLPHVDGGDGGRKVQVLGRERISPRYIAPRLICYLLVSRLYIIGLS